ncbi:ArsA family ATPase [Streptomyces sp. TRM66268-LWL]|uniref:ArsA family ATPase n=1 Tax=Streptomyces polyasparticus TaxID=2767826 RepID=A0ABR7SB84_9ACTN|nr:ArsA family ATPase [Streptomyces polyasparticus]MBC9712274.1 ArsA family ATPase [Streptomyces polyasparticus]
MRTLFVTGPGGAGRTTVAAATAQAAAAQGSRTLLLGDDPHGVDGVTVKAVDPARHFRAELLALQERAATALDLFGARRLDDDELTPLPGAAELALLRAVGEAQLGPYDLVVVDLPPTAQALAALALPAQLRRYVRRLLPPERQAARALRPMLAQLAGVPMPAQWLYESAARWDAHLAGVQAVIESEDTAVRIVAEPGPAGADAVRTAAMGLALYGLRTESVLANRVLPGGSADPWLAGLAAQQDKVLAQWRGDGLPVAEVAHLGRDPRGGDDLAALGVPAPGHVAPQETWPIDDRLADDGILVWRIPLPGAVREELDLVRRGDELAVTAGEFRRIVPLPSALRRCTVSGAGLADGELGIRFTPDPGLWPQGRQTT